MPRKTIKNEEEAAKLVASVAVKVTQKKATSQELHSIATAMGVYATLLKQGRDAARQKNVEAREKRIEKSMKEKIPDPIRREIIMNDLLKPRK